ncbi:RagB/SusD family nutrient uptake outer membrane protein [Parabacteroides pacaensis]|uniref:RagB/SusD family nutrient uptake outer membrane protein n=1 Tax=Parabacteroides pacaensis TaxID=2086575 RepID=UPI000D1090C7|nr:RagB/SusD family nutrient uptake outer membrane protein [Parabacteroides pacaensis]
MKKILTLCISWLCLISCSDSFLDLAPQHYLNESTFFKTEEHFTQATNGVYERLRGITNVPAALMGEMRSDNTHYIRYEADRAQRQYEEIADFINDEQNIMTDDMYYNCFSGISRANTILERITDKPFTDEFKNSVIGQAKFLRALFYFYLVRYFGEVPLYLKEVKGPDGAFLPRSSVDDVYEVILSDLNDAIAKLPVVKFPQNGTATQGAARMLLADVLMTKPVRDYAGAETQLKEILKMGYELLPDYADVFDISKKNNKESVFEVQYQEGDQGQESNWLYYFIPRTSDAEVITGVPNTNTIADAGWNVPTQEMVNSYEKGDLRLNPSIAIIAGHNNEYGQFMCEKVLTVDSPEIENYPIFYYFVNKYRHPHSKIRNTDDNWPIYRYSNVLLSLAECLVEQGRPGEAIPYVNLVRNRAGLASLSVINAEVIANERRHELAFENHRWFDLIRTGKAIEVMSAHGKRMKALYPYLQERTYQIDKDKLLFPIPYHELQINSLLKQNPGYK